MSIRDAQQIVAHRGARRPERLVDQPQIAALIADVHPAVALEQPASGARLVRAEAPVVGDQPPPGPQAGERQREQRAARGVVEVVQDTEGDHQAERAALAQFALEIRRTERPHAELAAVPVARPRGLDVGRLVVHAQILDIRQEGDEAGRTAAQIQQALARLRAQVLLDEHPSGAGGPDQPVEGRIRTGNAQQTAQTTRAFARHRSSSGVCSRTE